MARGRSSTYIASDPSISGFAPRCAKFCSSFNCDNDSCGRNCHHSPTSSKLVWPHLKVLGVCYGKTFCIGYIQVSIYFGIHRNFRYVKNFEDNGYSLWNADHKASRVSQPMDFGWQWIDIIGTNYFIPPSKEKEEKLKFSRNNMSIRARVAPCILLAYQWINRHGIDRLSSFHQYSHAMVRPSASISRLVYPSWMQAQTCAL